MKYKKGDIIIYNSKKYAKILNFDTDLNNYSSYELENLEETPFVNSWIDANLLEKSTISIRHLRTEKFKKLLE